MSWYLLTAGLTPLLIPFARDRVSWVLVVEVAAYIALISNVCFIKPYYLITPILFTSPVAVRTIHGLRDRFPALRLGRIRIAPDTAVACLFAVIGAFCLAWLARHPLPFSDSFPRL